MLDNIAGLVFAALYITEHWYIDWQKTGNLYSKTRSIVVYDCVLNERT